MCLLPDPEVTETVRWRAIGGHTQEAFTALSFRVRYELWKLRAKGLIEKLPHSRRYRLLPNGYRICLLFLKLFDKIYAPLTAGLLHPYPGDRTMTADRLHQLDKLYQSVIAALDQLVAAVGLKLAA